MAEGGHSQVVNWYCPQMRGQLSIPDPHIPKRLKKNLRQMKINGAPYEVRIDTNFEEVMRACAQTKQGRDETWINEKIIESFCALHDLGYAHSVEVYQEEKLVGGLYGVSIGAVFCGESMFSCVRDASKVALVHLVARLFAQGYQVLDTQFVNDHLQQFGVYEIAHEDYLSLLERWAGQERVFYSENGKSEKRLIQEYLEQQMRKA